MSSKETNRISETLSKKEQEGKTNSRKWTPIFVIFAIVISVLAIFGCGGDEEEAIQLLNTAPPDGGEIGNLGTLTMTFDGEPTEVTIDSPGGSRNAKITGKTATYTFTADDSLVPGSEVPIGISWVSKGGNKGSKIVRLTIVAGGNGVDIERWKNVTSVSTYVPERSFDKLALSLYDPFLALTREGHSGDFGDVTVLKIPTLETVMEIKDGPWLEPDASFIPNQQILVAEGEWQEENEELANSYIIYKIPTGEVVKEFKLNFFLETATTYGGKTILIGNKRRASPMWGFLYKELAVSTIDGEILMHDPRRITCGEHEKHFRLSHGGRYYVATLRSIDEVRVWEVPAKLIQVFTPTVDGEKAGIGSCDVSFDGKYVAMSLREAYGEKRMVKVLEIDSLQEVFTHNGDYYDVDFSPNGRLLAVAYYHDRIVKILSIPDGATVTIIEHAATWCSFSADGNYLITAKGNENIKVWKPE